MLSTRRQPFQMMLSVAGTIGVVASVLIGADLGVLFYGAGLWLGACVALGAVAGLMAAYPSARFQRARWRGATSTTASTTG